MKKVLTFMLSIAMLAMVSINAYSYDSKGKLGVSLNGGASIPVNGDFQADKKLSDIVDAGAAFGLSVNYWISNSFALQGDFSMGMNYFKDEYKGAYKDPLFSSYAISLSGIYNFENFIGNSSSVLPILQAGVGMYPWSFSQDGLGGDAIKTFKGDDFSATSFGINVGVGVSYNVIENLQISLLAKYDIFFAKDEDKFGTDFAEQGFLTPKLAVSYLIPVAK